MLFIFSNIYIQEVPTKWRRKQTRMGMEIWIFCQAIFKIPDDQVIAANEDKALTILFEILEKIIENFDM